MTGPGIVPTIIPVLQPGDEAYARWRTTNVRPQKQFGYLMATVTVPLGDLSSEQMRVLGELARAYGDGTVRVTPGSESRVPLGQRVRRPPAVSPRGRGRSRAGRSRQRRRRRELPRRGVVPAGGHAVARASAGCSKISCARGPI